MTTSSPYGLLTKRFSLMLIAWVVTIVCISLFYHLQFISFFKNYLSLLSCGVLIYIPMMMTWKFSPPIPLFENHWAQFFKSLKIFILTSLIIFPIILVLNHFFQSLAFHRHFFLAKDFSPLLSALPYHLLLVALPEEFFYRSYMQTVMDDYFGKPFKLFGAKIGWGLVLTSFLFAFSHSIVTIKWWHFSIFFPSLVFGWLKNRTGCITASILFHTAANLLSTLIGLNYR